MSFSFFTAPGSCAVEPAQAEFVNIPDETSDVMGPQSPQMLQDGTAVPTCCPQGYTGPIIAMTSIVCGAQQLAFDFLSIQVFNGLVLSVNDGGFSSCNLDCFCDHPGPQTPQGCQDICPGRSTPWPTQVCFAITPVQPTILFPSLFNPCCTFLTPETWYMVGTWLPIVLSDACDLPVACIAWQTSGFVFVILDPRLPPRLLAFNLAIAYFGVYGGKWNISLLDSACCQLVCKTYGTAPACPCFATADSVACNPALDIHWSVPDSLGGLSIRMQEDMTNCNVTVMGNINTPCCSGVPQTLFVTIVGSALAGSYKITYDPLRNWWTGSSTCCSGNLLEFWFKCVGLTNTFLMPPTPNWALEVRCNGTSVVNSGIYPDAAPACSPFIQKYTNFGIHYNVTSVCTGGLSQRADFIVTP